MVKVQNWPVKDLDPGRGWIHCVYGSDHPLILQRHKQAMTSGFSMALSSNSTTRLRSRMPRLIV